MLNYWLDKTNDQSATLDQIGSFIKRSILNFWQEEEFASPLFYSKVKEFLYDIRNSGVIEEFSISIIGQWAISSRSNHENPIVIGIKMEDSNWVYFEQELA